ncbi:hypothetical protein HRbin40_01704 [bacterium HR40]|nr:hypothetical protein HRbin40_01704 [bacterium HR40]
MRRSIVAVLGVLATTLLGMTPAAAALEVGERAVVAVRPGVRVNVRATPEIANGNVVGVATAGREVEIVASERRGDQLWYRVRALDRSFEGWMRGDMLQGEAVARPAVTADPPAVEQVRLQAPEPAASVPPRPATDWSIRLRELLPAIDSCLRQGSAPPLAVLRAREMPLDMVEVVLRDASNRYWSCVVDRQGRTPIAWNPVPAPSTTARSSGPVFYRQTANPLEDRCYQAEPVRDERDGTLLGTLLYPICR